MSFLAEIFVLIVALLHLYFLVLEMFLWQTPRGLKTFGMTPQIAAQSAVLAKNQGLYNGFLAAGLIWSFFIADSGFSESVRLFFLSCTTIAGLYGAWTAKPIIFFVQALPSILALLFVYLA